MGDLEIGDTVKRDTTEAGYCDEIGTVIEFNYALERVRVKWATKRTWYKASKLIKITL